MAIDKDNFQALSAFAVDAADYCQFIDRFGEGRPEKLYTQLEALLPRLQRAILPVEKEMAEQKPPAFDKLGMI
jgi:hypothetical protein